MSVPFEQLESNKFVEGELYPKTTVRTSLNDSSGNPIDGSNPLEVTGTFVTTLEQVENAPTTNSVSVGTVVVNLFPSPLTDRKTIVVSNTSNDTPVYLGNASVNTSNGINLEGREKISIDMDDGATVYAISSSGTVDVRVMELK